MKKPDFSDLWCNPAEPGWGLAVHHHANDQLVATWLGYDDTGSPTWLSLLPGGWANEWRFDGQLYRFRSTKASQAYDSKDLEGEVVGSGSLVFSDANRGTLTYDLRGTRHECAIERMVF